MQFKISGEVAHRRCKQTCLNRQQCWLQRLPLSAPYKSSLCGREDRGGAHIAWAKETNYCKLFSVYQKGKNAVEQFPYMHANARQGECKVDWKWVVLMMPVFSQQASWTPGAFPLSSASGFLSSSNTCFGHVVLSCCPIGVPGGRSTAHDLFMQMKEKYVEVSHFGELHSVYCILKLTWILHLSIKWVSFWPPTLSVFQICSV